MNEQIDGWTDGCRDGQTDTQKGGDTKFRNGVDRLDLIGGGTEQTPPRDRSEGLVDSVESIPRELQRIQETKDFPIFLLFVSEHSQRGLETFQIHDTGCSVMNPKLLRHLCEAFLQDSHVLTEGKKRKERMHH